MEREGIIPVATPVSEGTNIKVVPKENKTKKVRPDTQKNGREKGPRQKARRISEKGGRNLTKKNHRS